MIYLRINEILKEKGKTKYWFIKHMDGGYQSLSHLLDNETISIHFNTLDKLCDVLECEVADLFKREKHL